MPMGHGGTQLSEGIQIDAPTELIKRRQNPQRIIALNISEMSISDAEWFFV